MGFPLFGESTFLVDRSFMKIFGVEMNYPLHNKEAADTLYNTETPVIFTKADSALLSGGKPFFVPDFTEQCEYETELVIRIGHLGRCIPERFAHRYYHEMTVGIDFTARDLECHLREKGLPWDIAKGFDGSAVIGNWLPCPTIEQGGVNKGLHFRLDINGVTVQQGNTADMLCRVDRIVSYISRFFMLKTGDLIFTGTPVGVGPVHIDDHLEGFLEGEKVLEFNVK